MIDTSNNKQNKSSISKNLNSDEDFQMEKEEQKSSSSSQESIILENSGSSLSSKSEDIISEENKRAKPSIKRVKKSTFQVSDTITTRSVGGSTTSKILTHLPMIHKPNLNPFDIKEEVEEIEGQKIPDFLRKEFIRDKNLKRPDDPEYDPSTLDIPEEMFKKLTPGMKQYWEVKRDHFDSVVMWRISDRYTFYYHDVSAYKHIATEDNWIFYNMPGFHQNKLDFYISEFIKAGYKVVRVEQTENFNQMKYRIAKTKETQAVVNREIAAKYTKGTFLKPLPIKDFLKGKYQDDEEELDTKYVLMYLFDEKTNTFGINYFDITTLQFFIGQFKDDSMK